jgi:glycosyltransferase involved in cell wall biosynthesis
MTGKFRIAIVISHPIQHFCPQYSSFSANPLVQLKVFFASTLGYKQYHDPNFGEMISWSNLRLESFEHEFLNGGKIIPVDKNIDAVDLDKRLLDFKPDVIVIYGYFQKLQRRAYKWAKRNNVSLAYISDSERNRDKNLITGILKYPYLRRYFSGIRTFLTVGDANEAYYRFYGVPGEKFKRMHFPIDIKLYEQSFLNKAELRKAVRTCFNIGEDETVLSVVGKLVRWKNQGDIIDAMAELEKQEIYLHLFILGSGEMMESWKNKAGRLSRSEVHFMGFVKPEDLPSFYAATDIYIHPASLEPHSLAISEAIFMGCPVILSDKCGSYGISDDVQVDKNGYVYQCGNIRQLAEIIGNLSADKSLQKKFGEYSHKIAIEFQLQSHSNVLKDLRSVFSNA